MRHGLRCLTHPCPACRDELGPAIRDERTTDVQNAGAYAGAVHGMSDVDRGEFWRDAMNEGLDRMGRRHV